MGLFCKIFLAPSDRRDIVGRLPVRVGGLSPPFWGTNAILIQVNVGLCRSDEMARSGVRKNVSLGGSIREGPVAEMRREWI